MAKKKKTSKRKVTFKIGSTVTLKDDLIDAQTVRNVYFEGNTEMVTLLQYSYRITQFSLQETFTIVRASELVEYSDTIARLQKQINTLNEQNKHIEDTCADIKAKRSNFSMPMSEIATKLIGLQTKKKKSSWWK